MLEVPAAGRPIPYYQSAEQHASGVGFQNSSVELFNIALTM